MKSSSSSRRVSFRETFDRNYISHGRAISEFLLKPSQLEGLKNTFRRSPYESGVVILVYDRKDVEQRAIEVWGSLANLEKERKRRDLKAKSENLYNYEIKKSLREARRSESQCVQRNSLKTTSTKEAIIIAIALLSDFANFMFKLVVYFITYSDSMLAETIHSAADTLNQSILVIGLCQMQQEANSKHPYGYSNMMYVVSLISGVGIFCLGAAVSVYNGIVTLTIHSHVLLLEDIGWAFGALGFSAFIDTVSLFTTIVATYKGARNSNLGFFYYAFRGIEPGLTVILMEDFVAVLGNIVAASLLLVTLKTDSYVSDAVGSIAIGFLLATVAVFLIVTNTNALVGSLVKTVDLVGRVFSLLFSLNCVLITGLLLMDYHFKVFSKMYMGQQNKLKGKESKSIQKERLEEINKVLESDVMVRAVYDVKGIDMGNKLVRYKAEIDFDGAELTRLYLDRQDIDAMLEEVRKISNTESLESFMVTHGESIVDLLGGEIDRIELKVRKLFPEVRHMDLEIL